MDPPGLEVPAAHWVQLNEPAILLKEPATQVVHDEAPELLKVPAVQLLHGVDPPRLEVPAVQTVQDVCPEVDVNRPPLHVKQLEDPADG